ncbi:MAG TPA: HAD-IIIA family hydrolase [Angustibacter sp.]|nr:HAD-IIIA family hydrolase [Angustibacter sp.]
MRSWSVVVPSLGRPSLTALLQTLAAQANRPDAVLVVDDRPQPDGPLDLSALPGARALAGGGRGPAHARNVGWQAATTEWVVFVDDDVLLPDDWSARLVTDLDGLGADVAGSQARLRVPLPVGRRPTDWERGTAGLATASWITAEMAYRRTALVEVGGFDERFPRAFREDADLAWRVQQRGHALVKGTREVVHPVRPAGTWASLHQQRGNADDALMRRLHGPTWRDDTVCPPGRFGQHVATVAAAGAAAVAGATGHRRVASAAATGWLALTAEFARRRIAPGPRTGDEVRRMLLTSVAIPFAAVWHRAAGEWHHRDARPWRAPLKAVLFDRDGTLVEDVPYNGDPEKVRPVEGAAEAVKRLRDNGIAVGVVTNQSAVGRGLLTRDEVDAVNARVEELLGPFDTWQVCPHDPADGCSCRKPRPGLVQAAAHDLGVRPHELAVVGDIGSDVEAAGAAGSAAVLVPTPVTLPEEVAAAPVRARTILEAVDLLLGSGS